MTQEKINPLHCSRKALIAILRGYQVLISPLLGKNCRFQPSCSSYAITAIETHGILRGGCLATRRVLRCHPWHPGGYDPVPPHRAASAPGE